MRVRAFLVVLAAVAVLAPAALASGRTSSTNLGYPSAENVQPAVQKGAKVKKVAKKHQAVLGTAGTLPFTGMDLAFLVGGGLVLSGVGFSVRRLSR